MLKHQQICLEAFEHFQRQTMRSRCEIYTANGRHNLVVPVEKSIDGKRRTVKEVKISYDHPWQQIHWRTLSTAYRSSAYFEFYEDRFRPYYEKKTIFLFDLNMELLIEIFSILKFNPEILLTEEYFKTIDDSNLIDKRGIFDSDKNQSSGILPYNQVFADRHGFQPDLSIVDLIFNKGPDARMILE